MDPRFISFFGSAKKTYADFLSAEIGRRSQRLSFARQSVLLKSELSAHLERARKVFQTFYALHELRVVSVLHNPQEPKSSDISAMAVATDRCRPRLKRRRRQQRLRGHCVSVTHLGLSRSGLAKRSQRTLRPAPLGQNPTPQSA